MIKQRLYKTLNKCCSFTHRWTKG